MKGSSASSDLITPILDNFLGLSEKFPENELKALLHEYRMALPQAQRDYLVKLKSERERVNMIEYCK